MKSRYLHYQLLIIRAVPTLESRVSIMVNGNKKSFKTSQLRRSQRILVRMLANHNRHTKSLFFETKASHSQFPSSSAFYSIFALRLFSAKYYLLYLDKMFRCSLYRGAWIVVIQGSVSKVSLMRRYNFWFPLFVMNTEFRKRITSTIYTFAFSNWAASARTTVPEWANRSILFPRDFIYTTSLRKWESKIFFSHSTRFRDWPFNFYYF